MWGYEVSFYRLNDDYSVKIEDIEIKGPFKFSNNSVYSSNYINGYNDVAFEIIKQN